MAVRDIISIALLFPLSICCSCLVGSVCFVRGAVCLFLFFIYFYYVCFFVVVAAAAAVVVVGAFLSLVLIMASR